MEHETPLELWMGLPISITEKNANGKLIGDDTGYRNVRTLRDNPAALMQPDVLIRACYEGVSAYDGSIVGGVLGGGLKNGAFVLREAAARSVSLAAKTLEKISGGAFRLVALDAFRSGLRQQYGYAARLKRQMAAVGLTEDDVNCNKRIDEFIGCSVRADGVFSWVKVAQDAKYVVLTAELKNIPAIYDACIAYAKANPSWGNADDALYEYVVACSNGGGFAADRCTLVWENNAHAGGGACDLMIVDAKGLLKAITPFDYPGHMSAYDYLENDAHYPEYRAKLLEDTVLQDHLTQCGYDPNNFTLKNWKELRDIKRLQYNLGRACGWTFYSMGHHGGEHWHEEPGNRVIDPLTGDVVWAEPETASDYPDRGNPGHTLQKFGPNDLAVWGGATAHAIAKAKLGLEMEI